MSHPIGDGPSPDGHAAQLVVYTTTQAIRTRVVLGTEFCFVRCRPEHLFGSTGHWITKTENVQVSRDRLVKGPDP